jgi:hypothetical protein
MYQILALTCLISSYSLSVLHLDGVKYGDYQVRALAPLNHRKTCLLEIEVWGNIMLDVGMCGR